MTLAICVSNFIAKNMVYFCVNFQKKCIFLIKQKNNDFHCLKIEKKSQRAGIGQAESLNRKFRSFIFDF